MSTLLAIPAAGLRAPSAPTPANRRLAWGLLVSLLLHALLLSLQFGVPGLRTGATSSLSVVLAPSPAVPMPVPPAPVVPPAPIVPVVPGVTAAAPPLASPTSTSLPRHGFTLRDPTPVLPAPPAPKPAPPARRTLRRRSRPRVQPPRAALHTEVIARQAGEDPSFVLPQAELPAMADVREAPLEPPNASRAPELTQQADEEAAAMARANAERELAQQVAEQRRAEDAARRQLDEQRRAEEQARQQLAEQQHAQQLADKREAEEVARQQLAEQQRAQQLAEQRRAEEVARQQLAEERRVEEVVRQQLAEQQRAQQLAEQRQAEERAQQAAARQRAEELARQQAAQAEAARRLAQQASGQPAAQPGGSVTGAERDAGAGSGQGSGLGGVGGARGLPGRDFGSRARELLRGIDIAKAVPPAMRAAEQAQQAMRRAPADAARRDVPLRMYLDSVRQKIERNATISEAQLPSRTVHTDPVVSIAIRSDGSIEDVTILRSSGRPDVDEIVRRVVRLNARYAAFPANVAANYDVIELRRIWTFAGVLRLVEEVR